MRKFILSLIALATMTISANAAVETAGNGTADNPYTVDDIINLKNANEHTNVKTEVWIKGYITGYSAKSGSTYSYYFDSNAKGDSNVLISDAPNSTESAPFLTIQLATDASLSGAVGLMTNPLNFGKELYVLGKINTAGYLGHTGVKSITDYKLSGISAPEFRPVGGIYNCPLTLVLAGDGDCSVHYTFGEEIPTAGSAQFNKGIDITETATVNAVAVNNGNNSGAYTSQTYTIVPATEGTSSNPYTVANVLEFNPTTTTAADGQSNVWVKGYIVGWMVRNAATKENTYYFSTENAASPNILIADDPNCKDGEKCIPVQLNNTSYIRPAINLKDNPENMGKELKVCGLMLNYLARPGVRETKLYEWASGTDGITESAAADDNAPVEYYNLQGMRVTNPSKGIYIMRRGNKVTKVLK